MRVLRAAAILIALLQAGRAIAQPLVFGERRPLTNTHYGERSGTPLLTTNGNDFFLVWATPDNIRVSRANSTSPGRPVLATNGYPPVSGGHDILWMGTQFLVAATSLNPDGTTSIVGRMLNADGEPLGDPFVIADGARNPRLAFNGTNPLVVYKAKTTIAQFLTPEGRPTTRVWGFPAEGDRYTVISRGAEFLLVSASGTTVMTFVIDGGGSLRVTKTFTGIYGVLGSVGRSASFAGIGTANGYLLVYRDVLFRVAAVNLNRDGEYVSPAWNDSLSSNDRIALTRWRDGVAVAAMSSDGKSVRLLRVDGSGNVTTEVIAEPAGVASVTIAAAGDEVLAAWSGSNTSIRVSSGGVRSFGAPDQTIELVASSDDALLTIWREGTGSNVSYHAGVYTRMGDWNEIELPAGQPVAARIGGSQCVVVMKRGTLGYAALRWSLDLQRVGSDTPLPRGIFFLAVGWNGKDFALIGFDSSERPSLLSGWLLSPNGALSARKDLARPESTTFLDLSVASDGTGFLVAWKAKWSGGCNGGWCEFMGWGAVYAVRLDGDLTAHDPVVLNVADKKRAVSNISTVAWDGNAYVVAWKDNDTTSSHARRIPAAGEMSDEFDVPALPRAQDWYGTTPFSAERASAAAIDGGVAVMWREGNDDRLFVIRGETVSQVMTFHHEERLVSPPYLASFGGSLAYLVSAVHSPAPSNGAIRALIRFGGLTLPPKADAPELAAEVTRGRAQLTWNAPPQETSGYRVEMRIGKGTWVEAGEWIPVAAPRFLSVPVNPSSGPISFRVRAWNDAGGSAYSNEVTIYTGKRRAIT